MNFDEASELFSDETLESMQMAKVNGGGFWKFVGPMLIDMVPEAVYAWFSDDDDKTTPTVPITINKDGMQYLTGTNIRIDSMKVINGIPHYWLSGSGSPTPTPTLAFGAGGGGRDL